MELQITGRSGVLSEYIITGATPSEIIKIEDIATYFTRISSDFVVTGEANKKQITEFRAMAQASQPVKSASSNTVSRKIVTLDYAEKNSLNHGQAWRCNERNIETQGVNPSLEGEIICYAYNR